MGKDNSTLETQTNFSKQFENFNNSLQTIREEFDVVYSECTREQHKIKFIREILLYFSNNMTFSEEATGVVHQHFFQCNPVTDLGFNPDKYNKLVKSASSNPEPDYAPILNECSNEILKFSNQFLEEVLFELNQCIKNVSFFSLREASGGKAFINNKKYNPHLNINDIIFDIGFK